MRDTIINIKELREWCEKARTQDIELQISGFMRSVSLPESHPMCQRPLETSPSQWEALNIMCQEILKRLKEEDGVPTRKYLANIVDAFLITLTERGVPEDTCPAARKLAITFHDTRSSQTH